MWRTHELQRVYREQSQFWTTGKKRYSGWVGGWMGGGRKGGSNLLLYPPTYPPIFSIYRAAKRWLLTALTGVLIGLLGVGMTVATQRLVRFKFQTVTGRWVDRLAFFFSSHPPTHLPTYPPTQASLIPPSSLPS